MLDLKTIFDPDRKAPAPAPGEGIGPDDLPGDWRVEWEERAAIMEFDGKMPRERAEALALKDIIKMMRAASVLLGHSGGHLLALLPGRAEP
jgi:hypothetical protein